VDHDLTGDAALDAGDFSAWLAGMRGALAGTGVSDVPCNGCTACCRSSQFVHIEPDELDTLAHVPSELQFPAPGLPEGHVVLGYDERGHCPMLGENGCSIYEHRPRACRVYDCRVFAATGVEIDDPSKAAIAERIRRWRFSHASRDGRARHEATRAAARYLEEHRDELAAGAPPIVAAGRAVLAVEIVDLFLGTDPDTGAPVVVEPAARLVTAEIERRARTENAARSGRPAVNA
jgi:Fe-S-cluster containining protein